MTASFWLADESGAEHEVTLGHRTEMTVIGLTYGQTLKK